MAEVDHNRTEETKNYTPASFEKRAAAWMGVVYVLMLMGILWYALFFQGREMPGTFPLFLVPVSVTLGVVTAHRLRAGTTYGGVPGSIVAFILSAAGTIFGLVLGVPALLAAFTG